jgi:hypothetical protein
MHPASTLAPGIVWYLCVFKKYILQNIKNNLQDFPCIAPFASGQNPAAREDAYRMGIV